MRPHLVEIEGEVEGGALIKDQLRGKVLKGVMAGEAFIS